MRRVLALAVVSLALVAIAASLWFFARGTPGVAPALDGENARVTTSPSASSPSAQLERSPAERPETALPDTDRALDAMTADELDAERTSANGATHAPGLTLRGRVTSPAGQPIVGANVRIRSSVNGGASAGTKSGLDGAFELSGLKPAIYTLDARASAHVTRELWPLVIAEGELVANIEVVLTPVATLTGRMIDEHDAAVPGVFVYAMPVCSPGGMAPTVSAATREDGSFTLPLNADARHWLWTEVGRYSGWESWLTDAPDFAPNTSGIEIRVRSTRPARVFAADAGTRAPIRSFGLREISRDVPWRDRGPREFDPLAAQMRPPLALPSDAGRPLLVESPPQNIVVWADGYAVREQSLSGEPEQTVLLERLGGLRGSFSQNGAPFKRGTLIVRTHSEIAREEWDPPPAERNADAVTGAGFQVDELPPGSYDVFARVGNRGETPALRTSVVVAPGRVTDLGELDLGLGTSTVRLKLVLPDDVRAADYWRLLDVTLNSAILDLPERVKGTPDLFIYDELPAGRFEIAFAESHALLGPPRRWFASIAAGSLHELKLDLSDLTLCDVTVKLALGSAHTATHHLCLYAADSDAREQLSCLALIRFGGELTLRARGSSRVVVDACDASHEPLSSSGPVELPRTGRREIVVFVP